MNRITDIVAPAQPHRSREPAPQSRHAPPAFASMLQTQTSMGGDIQTRADAADGLLAHAPASARTPQASGAPDPGALSAAQSFSSTGPLGLARPTNTPFAPNATASYADPTQSIQEDISGDALHWSATSGKDANGAVLVSSEGRAQAGSIEAVIGPAPKASSASIDAMPQITTPRPPTQVFGRSPQRPAQALALRRPNPNALVLRLVEEAGAIGVRATLAKGAVGDDSALAAEVERTLREHALGGALFINGRRVHARQERFDV